jgi:hypothetical protein
MDDGSKEQPHMTAGLDLGDKYSYLCLIDQESGEMVEEGLRLLKNSPYARFHPRSGTKYAVFGAFRAGFVVAIS